MEFSGVVLVGQVLQLVNESSNRKADARVVSVQRKRDGKVYVAVEFLSSEINFWHMTFPISGARPLRKLLGQKQVSA